MRGLLLVLGFLASFLPQNKAIAGPIFITRGLLIHPAYTPSQADTGGFLTRTSMWGGVQRGLGSAEERFGWLLDLGAVVELYQWEHSSLLAISGMQLNADIHNEISFNPSGIIWEEHLMYATRGEYTNWQLGFAQRCRHDVDNLDIKEATGEAQQRTLIYSSITAKAVLPRYRFWNTVNLRPWFEGDVYLISQDYRIPKAASSAIPSIEKLAASIGMSYDIRFNDDVDRGWYLNLATTVALYGRETGFIDKFATVKDFDVDQRLELGYIIPGRSGKLRIFAGTEFLRDDGTMPYPEKNQYVFLGFRIAGQDLQR